MATPPELTLAESTSRHAVIAMVSLGLALRGESSPGREALVCHVPGHGAGDELRTHRAIKKRWLGEASIEKVQPLLPTTPRGQPAASPALSQPPAAHDNPKPTAARPACARLGALPWGHHEAPNRGDFPIGEWKGGWKCGTMRGRAERAARKLEARAGRLVARLRGGAARLDRLG